MNAMRRLSLLSILFLFITLSSSSTSASSISADAVFQSHISTGRSLLQAKKGCPVNFEFSNYTILTSQCKGPSYPAKECCAALKQFACPYTDEINDLSTDCASIMFSYINLNGRYPPGLFANMCVEGKEGLACPDDTSSNQSAANSSAGAQSVRDSSPLMIAATSGFLLLLLF